jgi:sulfate/thiosulfate transport system substrate-binding protein
MRRVRIMGAAAALSLLGAACSSTQAAGGGAAGECETPETPTLTLAAYSTPREVYGKIIPAFQEKWKEEHNDQTVIFQESYGGSTSQAENVINGFDADIVALSLGPDVDQIVDAGLITHDWTDAPDGGMVSTSIAVFDVRPGNPDDIADFDDLAKTGLEVLTPDPVSSGGARWNLVAAYGAAMRGHSGNEADDEGGARQLLEGILGNVIVFDKTARDSIKNFEAGNGDVAITYENEILTAQAGGLDDEMVIPPSTVLIQNPVALVDEYVDEHCVREVAEAFVEFLHSKEAKELYTDVGHLRSTDLKAAQKGGGDQFAPVEDLWTVDELGGWDFFNSQFEDGGLFTQALEKAQS